MTTAFVYDGNLACLDLLNTVVIVDGSPVDRLDDVGSVIAWLEGLGQLTTSERRELEETLIGEPEGERLRELAVRLREAVRRIADRILEGTEPGWTDVEEVNDVLAEAPTVTRIAPVESGGFAVAGAPRGGAAALLGPVAHSAAELLTELDWGRLGRCHHDECILYFYDTSKNRSRRWCSMERCGNRAKVAAHYKRLSAG